VQPASDLAARLSHVRWLGGGTGAGKSTVARRLAAVHGLRLHTCEPFTRYVDRSSPADHPLLHAFIQMDMDERWLQREPEVMLATFHGYQDELFHLILEDVLDLPVDPPLLVEGFSLLPRLVHPLVSGGQAVWLIPDAAFRRAAFEARGTLWDIAGRTSDPERALQNLLRRDELFTEQVRREATALDLPVLDVRVGVTEDELAARVAHLLALPGT
jgi:2-phosphoglycerate kinase